MVGWWISILDSSLLIVAILGAHCLLLIGLLFVGPCSWSLCFVVLLFVFVLWSLVLVLWFFALCWLRFGLPLVFLCLPLFLHLSHGFLGCPLLGGVGRVMNVKG